MAEKNDVTMSGEIESMGVGEFGDAPLTEGEAAARAKEEADG